MISQHEIQVTDSGNGYVIGEMGKKHPHLTYLRPESLVVLVDGVDKVLDLVQEKMPVPLRGKSSVNEGGGGGGFNAFVSYDEAMTTFRSHPEKVVQFDPSELRIKDASEAGSQVDYDVTGDYIDMGRYMEGIPEVMGTMHNGNARNRRVNVIINLNQMAGMPHESIQHRGERVLRLIDALEAGGVRTRLVGIESNECGHTEITLKQFEEPLTISDLAVVTHPEFLRRIIFRINEHSKTWDWGYGSAVAFSGCLKPEILGEENVNELDLVIDSNIRSNIDTLFDKLERLLVWEMSKPVPEVSSIKLDGSTVWFNPNGARSEEEIKREGQEVINGE